MKWTCSHCGAINPQFSFKCHNCPNTCGDEGLNKLHLAIQGLEAAQEYICRHSHSCMRHPQGLLPTSHGPACEATTELLRRIKTGSEPESK